MENWEALDVDDSDLPSLLRPCINNKRKNPTTLSTFTPSQTLISPPQPHSVAKTRIPGPAGAVQVAMDRKKRGGCELSTQECIRRAVANDANDDDSGDDFGAGPWLSAVDFVTRLGPLPSTTPLRSVSKFLNIGRIDQVVAVIKSCSPNGFGDLMVTLKDPTGTIGASIHRKVFNDEEFGKEISVGSVLILQKVAVFAPSRSALYLNITRNNMVKVFSGDSRAPTSQKAFVPAVQPTSGHCKETAVTVEEATAMEVEITQGIKTGTEKYPTPTGSVNINIEMEKENFANSSTPIRRDQDNISAEKILNKGFQKENRGDDATSMEVEMTQGFNSGTGKLPNLTGSENISKEMEKENNVNSSLGVDQSDKGHTSTEKMPKKMFGKENEQRDLNVAANLDECRINEGITSKNGAGKEKQPLAATAFPEWTDEQLNELFSAGFDNDGCFF